MRRFAFGVVLALLALGCGGGSTDPTPPPPPPPPPTPTTVALSPATTTIDVGATTPLTATVRDQAGAVMQVNVTNWTTSNGTVASVSSSGVVTGVAPGGPVTITARVGEVSGTAQVTVKAAPVAVVELAPGESTIVIGETVQLQVVLKSANGSVLTGRSVDWSSSDAAIASVSGTGLVTAVAEGEATITATSEGKSATADVTVQLPPPAKQVVGGNLVIGGVRHTHFCVLKNDGSAWCWGAGTVGQLGQSNVNSTTPVPVSGGHQFKSLIGGSRANCGIDTIDVARCWGFGGVGYLGNGQTGIQSSPTPVTAPPSPFSSIAMAPDIPFACGITSGGVYCWGRDDPDFLPGASQALVPTLVPPDGMPEPVQLSLALTHHCLRTAAGTASCIGSNQYGQLGNGTLVSSTTWQPVSGGHVFTSIKTGLDFTCGLKADGTVWCWGRGNNGQLGVGPGVTAITPTQVLGITDAKVLTLGRFHACVIREGGAASCWGRNLEGKLGNGTTTSSGVPTNVSGGHKFVDIAATPFSTCGIATDGLYCWGNNDSGQIGDGTTTRRLVPTRVLGL